MDIIYSYFDRWESIRPVFGFYDLFWFSTTTAPVWEREGRME